MRKLMITGLVVVAVGLNSSIATSLPRGGVETQAGSRQSHPPSELIDGIKVPYGVLAYVQIKYQGHAVTQARKAMKDGKQIYSLRVDRDTASNDYKSFYLLFDLKWSLIGKQKMSPPPAAPAKDNKEESKTEDDNKQKDKKPSSSQQPRQETTDSDEEQPAPPSSEENQGGGSGGGSGGESPTPTEEN